MAIVVPIQSLHDENHGHSLQLFANLGDKKDYIPRGSMGCMRQLSNRKLPILVVASIAFLAGITVVASCNVDYAFATNPKSEIKIETEVKDDKLITEIRTKANDDPKVDTEKKGNEVITKIESKIPTDKNGGGGGNGGNGDGGNNNQAAQNVAEATQNTATAIGNIADQLGQLSLSEGQEEEIASTLAEATDKVSEASQELAESVTTD
jgi:hypothetical protein